MLLAPPLLRAGLISVSYALQPLSAVEPHGCPQVLANVVAKLHPCEAIRLQRVSR